MSMSVHDALEELHDSRSGGIFGINALARVCRMLMNGTNDATCVPLRRVSK